MMADFLGDYLIYSDCYLDICDAMSRSQRKKIQSEYDENWKTFQSALETVDNHQLLADLEEKIYMVYSQKTITNNILDAVSKSSAGMKRLQILRPTTLTLSKSYNIDFSNWITITKVTLTNCELTNRDVRKLRPLKNLQYLDVSDNGDITGKYIANIGRGKIFHLNLFNCDATKAEHLLEITQRHVLRELNLCGTYALSEERVSHMYNEMWQNLDKVESLDITYPIDAVGLRYFGELLPNLKALYVRTRENIQKLTDLLYTNPYIGNIDITGTNEETFDFGRTNAMKKLNMLAIKHFNLERSGNSPIAPNLEYLTLVNCENYENILASIVADSVKIKSILFSIPDQSTHVRAQTARQQNMRDISRDIVKITDILKKQFRAKKRRTGNPLEIVINRDIFEWDIMLNETEIDKIVQALSSNILDLKIMVCGWSAKQHLEKARRRLRKAKE